MSNNMNQRGGDINNVPFSCGSDACVLWHLVLSLVL